MSTNFKDHKLLAEPISKDGDPNMAASIVATLLSNDPLKKEEILKKIGVVHTGRSRGYLSNYFSALSKSGILQFIKHNKTWIQGERYQEYMGYVFLQVLAQDPKAVTSLQYRLMPKKDEQSMDFIVSPDDDIFNKPNPYIECIQAA